MIVKSRKLAIKEMNKICKDKNQSMSIYGQFEKNTYFNIFQSFSNFLKKTSFQESSLGFFCIFKFFFVFNFNKLFKKKKLIFSDYEKVFDIFNKSRFVFGYRLSSEFPLTFYKNVRKMFNFSI